MVQHQPDGLLELMLVLVLALCALDLAFPFAVVEGKAYSTGKQIFEAENQAAVSGACALKIQLNLDSLVNSGTRSSGALPTSSNTQPSLRLLSNNPSPSARDCNWLPQFSVVACWHTLSAAIATLLRS